MNYNRIEIVEISKIKILNPRSRNKVIHDEIKNSIDLSGLRKPVSVREIKDGKYKYALICGQGRLEALSAIGESHVPAIIKDINQEDAYVMSLVENIARRKPRASELYERISEMNARGISVTDIAKYLSCSENWVKSILLMLERGERKLLAAVESGKIPLYLAVEFSRSNGSETQDIMINAYEKGVINSKNVGKIRDILNLRATGVKGIANLDFQQHKGNKKISPDELLSLYQESVNQHKNLIAKHDYVIECLLVCRTIMVDLLSNDSFVGLLNDEGLNQVPYAIVKDNVELEKDNDKAML